MDADFNTDAILLRKIEYGDHDLIITFLTRDRGKISVMAKNAKKSVRRFSGAMDLFSVNHIQCTFPRKNRDAMINLCQTVLENGFSRIRYDVVNTAYASYWTEIVTQWLEEGKAQPDIFELLYTALEMVDDGYIRTEVISLLFQIRFMRLSGFSPGIDQCDTCSTRLEGIDSARLWFDFKAGRVVCSKCRGSEKLFPGTCRTFWRQYPGVLGIQGYPETIVLDQYRGNVTGRPYQVLSCCHPGGRNPAGILYSFSYGSKF